MNNHPVLLVQHILNFVVLHSWYENPWYFSFGYLASFSCPLFMKGSVYTSCGAMKAADLRVWNFHFIVQSLYFLQMTKLIGADELIDKNIKLQLIKNFVEGKNMPINRFIYHRMSFLLLSTRQTSELLRSSRNLTSLINKHFLSRNAHANIILDIIILFFVFFFTLKQNA